MNERQVQRSDRRRFLRLLGLGAVGGSLGVGGFSSAANALGGAATLERNKSVPRGFVERINVRDVDGAMSFLDPRFANYDEPGKVADLAATKAFFASLVTGFPDGHYSILDMIAEGDKVVVFMKGEGTHSGDFMGLPATGKKVSYLFIDIDRIKNGKILEHWGVSDNLGMMQQLGLALVPQ